MSAEATAVAAPKQLKVEPVIRCSSFKVRNIEEKPEVSAWYDDIQADFRKFFQFFFPHIGIGYRYYEGDPNNPTEHLVEPTGLNPGIIGEFLQAYREGQTTASSNYCLFSQSFKPQGGRPKKEEWLDRLCEMDDDQIAAIPGDGTLEEWKGLRELYQADGYTDEVRALSAKLATSEKRYRGIQIRKEYNLECRRPQESAYCVILSEMLGRAIRAVWEKYEQHIGETANMEHQAEGHRNEVSELLWAFVQEIQVTAGSSFKTLAKLIVYQDDVAKFPYMADAAELLKTPRFASLKEAIPDTDTLKSKYYYIDIMRQLARRKKYPVRPEMVRDYAVPVGASSLGGFQMSAPNNDPIFYLPFLGKTANLQCFRSYYFHGIKVTAEGTGYRIKFRNRVKTRRRFEVGDEHSAMVKEICLQRQNGNMYIRVPFNITLDDEKMQIVKRARNFFVRADQTGNADFDILPDVLRVGAIDLNIVNPLAGVKAEVIKGATDLPIQALDFGGARIIEEPRIILSAGYSDLPLIDLKARAGMLIKIIRAYKADLYRGAEFPEEMDAWLNQTYFRLTPESHHYLENVNPGRRRRHLIESWYKNIVSDLRSTHYYLRASGYANVSDSIRLLAVMDEVRALYRSYRRLHLKPGETLPNEPISDTTRAALRRDTSRRIAAAVARNYADCHVVFVENLSSEFSIDSENNALLRIFAPKMLLECIKLALDKKGIAMVEVNKEGTSLVDPVTGKIGYLEEGRRKRLYVDRSGNLGHLNSDTVAALNVMLCGLNRSLVPYRFTIAKKDSVEPLGKRRQQFFKRVFQTQSPVFVKEGSQIIQAPGKRLEPGQERVTGALYYREGKLLTVQQHKEEQLALKERVQAQAGDREPSEVIQPFHLIVDPADPLNNYRLDL